MTEPTKPLSDLQAAMLDEQKAIAMMAQAVADDVTGINRLPPIIQYPQTIEVFRKDPRARLPTRATPDAIGWDLYAFLLSESGREITRQIPRMNTIAIPTGICVKPPPGFFLQACSRSGMAKSSLFVANSPGIIDPDYTGEIIVLLYNGGYEAQYVKHEYRIAQLILSPIIPSAVYESQIPPEALGRGEAGFGSTGA